MMMVEYEKFMAIYLVPQLLVVGEEAIVVGFEFFVARFEGIELPLEHLCLGPGSPVLEPDRDLPRLQTGLLGQLAFPVRFELVLHLEALLQEPDLLRRQPPLLLRRVLELAVAALRFAVVRRLAAAAPLPSRLLEVHH